MLVQILISGGFSSQLVSDAPALTVTISSHEPVLVNGKEPRTPTETEFNPWFKGHNFGYTPDN